MGAAARDGRSPPRPCHLMTSFCRWNLPSCFGSQRRPSGGIIRRCGRRQVANALAAIGLRRSGLCPHERNASAHSRGLAVRSRSLWRRSLPGSRRLETPVQLAPPLAGPAHHRAGDLAEWRERLGPLVESMRRHPPGMAALEAVHAHRIGSGQILEAHLKPGAKYDPGIGHGRNVSGTMAAASRAAAATGSIRAGQPPSPELRRWNRKQLVGVWRERP